MGMHRKAALHAALLTAAGLAAGQAQAACSFGPAGSSPLQNAFDGLLVSGEPNVQTACVTDGEDAQWAVDGIGGATILLELAGNAGTNTFGVYDPNNPGEMVTIFSGGASTGDDAYLVINDNGNGTWDLDVLGVPGAGTLTLDSPVFGFYLGTSSQGTFYSDTSLNVDTTDHMFAYQGSGQKFNPGQAAKTFYSYSYILAWEDLALTTPGYDGDYEDFLVQVVNVSPAPVPLPGAAWLFMSGLIGLVGVARRRV